MFLPVALAACGSAPTEHPSTPAPIVNVPVEVHGADAAPIVGRCRSLPVAVGVETGCWRASAPSARAALLHRLGCDDDGLVLDDRALVAVVVPGAPRLERVMIGSEEGVDVLTLVLGAAPAAADPAARAAILLWVEPRRHQLAVVCRDVPADSERTVGIFDGQ